MLYLQYRHRHRMEILHRHRHHRSAQLEILVESFLHHRLHRQNRQMRVTILLGLQMLLLFLLFQFLRRYRPAIGLSEFGTRIGKRRWWEWRPVPLHAIFTLLLLYVTLREFDKISEFIYFQF